MVQAWTEENPFAWHGQYFNYECVSILPRPVQTPHPAIWSPVSAVESFTWCARNRIGAITSGTTQSAAEGLEFFANYARNEAGWDLGPQDMGVAREFYLAPTKAKFNEMAESLFARDAEDAYPHMRENPDLKALDQKRYELRSYSYRSTPGRGGRAPGGRTLNAIERGTFIAG